MATFIQKLQQHYRNHGLPDSRVVLRGENSQVTLARLVQKVEALGSNLQNGGIKTLALYAANSPEWVIADLACQHAGICLLPLPAFFSDSQLQHCLQEAGADALLSDNRQRTDALLDGKVSSSTEPVTGFTLQRLHPEKMAQIPDNTSKITFTSGSTGSPKGVCLDYAIQNQVAQSLSTAIELQAPDHLCLLPLSTLLENIGGVYSTLLSGGCVHLLPAQTLGFSGTGLDTSRLLASLESLRPNTVILLPEMLLALVLACEAGWKAPDSLAFMAVGGAKVSPALIRTARDHNLPVYEGYGLSECGSVVSLNTPATDGIGSSGLPLPHNRVTIGNGEVIVTGQLFLGYLNDPASWYPDSVATGDLASVGPEGFLQINGRRKNLLISSFGRNINPEWVESEVLANPSIRQCVVFGDDRPFCTALIVARAAVTLDSDIEQWLDQCNRHLPDYAQIRGWLRLPEPMDSRRGLWTANDRPKRAAIALGFRQEINRLYSTHSTIPTKVSLS